MAGGGDLARRQGVVVGALAEFAGVHRDRELDVGHDAGELRGGAVDAEELRDRQLHLAEALVLAAGPTIEIDQVLHRALAEGRFADDDAAAVVLDRGGEDFRGRSRTAVDQHGERPVPGDAGVLVALDADAAAGFAHLHDRAAIDEETGEFDRFDQRTAAVVAQVHHDAVDFRRAQFAEQAGDVGGGRARVRIAAARGFEIQVEARQFDHADAAAAGVDDLLAGGLFLELDLVAHQRHELVRAVGAGVGRDHVETDLGALLAADQVDDVVDAPADHIGHRAAVALADGDHAIADLHLAGFRGRTAGHDGADHDEFFLTLQHRADAFQRQAHRHVEVLGAARTHVAGMRIDRSRVRVHEALKHVVAAQFAHAAGELGVAFVERLADLVLAAAGELQAEHVVLDVLAPQLVELVAVGGPGGVLAVVDPAFLRRQVHRLGQ